MATTKWDATTKTFSITLTDEECVTFEDHFIGGPAEGLQSVVDQNIRQRKTVVAQNALQELKKQGGVAFEDDDDLIRQYTVLPHYRNAKTRKLDDDEKRVVEAITYVEALPASDPDRSAQLNALNAELKTIRSARG